LFNHKRLLAFRPAESFRKKHILGGMQMSQLFVRLWKEDEGQDLTEYALLLVLLSLAAIATLGTLANAINSVFNQAATNLTT
jgi:pilus assembly protein Flp/PilA